MRLTTHGRLELGKRTSSVVRDTKRILFAFSFLWFNGPMSFNIIDLLLVLLIFLSALNGWRRGFIRGVLDLMSWALGLAAALRFYQPVARWLGPRIDLWSEVWDQPISFLLVGICTGIAVHQLCCALV